MTHKMLPNLLMALAFLAPNGCREVISEPQPETPLEPAAAAARDDVLSAWEKNTSEIQSIDATFVRTDHQLVFGTSQSYEGRYLARGKDQFFLTFAAANDQPPQDSEHSILLAKSTIYIYNNIAKTALVFPASGGDPLESWLFLPQADFMRCNRPPMAFCIRAAELKESYQIRVLKDEADRVHLELIPRKAPDRQEYSRVLILLNRKTFLPEAVKFVGPSGKDDKLFVFKEVKTNVPIAETWFQPRKLPADWKETRFDADPQPKPPEK